MYVRRARESDLPAITEINDWYIAHTVANFNTEPVGLEAMHEEWLAGHERHPWLVAVDGSKTSPVQSANAPRSNDGAVGASIVGFAKASPWKGRCAYDWSAEVTVYLHHEHHRRGIGSMLYDRLFAILRDQGFRSVLAGVTLPNEGSVRLHERMGMTRVAYLTRVGWKFDAWHDVGYWQVALGGETTPPSPPSPPFPLRPVSDVYSE
jgi:phosphinothricin acetyltransferase